jgi:hypothetical protein
MKISVLWDITQCGMVDRELIMFVTFFCLLHHLPCNGGMGYPVGCFEIFIPIHQSVVHAVAWWLRHYAASRKVTGSRPDDVN